jgi:hypothetical protein
VGAVRQIYLDYTNWHKLFPATIQAARLIKMEQGVLTIEVLHRIEGKVINILTVLPNGKIKLEEFKPKYNAIFINQFTPVSGSTRYSVTANISLKGIYKIVAFFIRGIIRNRIMKFVLVPVKEISEKAQ